MSRSLRTAIGLCTALVCAFGLDVESHAQWARWEIGSGPWGGMRYRGPLLSIDIGAAVPPPVVGRPPAHAAYALPPAPVPPWHYRHDPPHPSRILRDQERFYYGLDHTHRYRTGEEQYADDFRDAYASGDAFYHAYHGGVSPRLGSPTLGALATGYSDVVPGLSYGPVGAPRRSFVADAEVADLLRPAATRLINSLSRKRDGAVWMQHLQPDRIVDAIDRAEFPGSLADLVEQYESVSRNPRLVLISEAEGFSDTQRLLSQYVLLQSRFATVDSVEPQYEVFMNPAPFDGAEEIVISPSDQVTDSPPLQLNPAAPLAPAAADPEVADEIQYLPAPAPEPDSQP